MEKRIRERFSPDILQQALASFDINLDQSNELDGFESYIYRFQRNDQKGILRISHTIRRSEALIQAELDWINHLHCGGVRVAQPLQSVNGHWLETIDDGEGGAFLVAAFDWAPGEIHRGEWPKPLLREYGAQLGRRHHLAKNYVSRDPAIKRAEWSDPRNLDFMQFLPKKDQKIK